MAVERRTTVFRGAGVAGRARRRCAGMLHRFIITSDRSAGVAYPGEVEGEGWEGRVAPCRGIGLD